MKWFLLPLSFLRRPATPAGLLSWAVLLAALFAVAHLLGLREYTSVFSRSAPGGGPGGSGALALAAAYAVLYLIFVLVVPVLMLAGLLLLLALWLLGPGREAGGPPAGRA